VTKDESLRRSLSAIATRRFIDCGSFYLVAILRRTDNVVYIPKIATKFASFDGMDCLYPQVLMYVSDEEGKIISALDGPPITTWIVVPTTSDDPMWNINYQEDHILTKMIGGESTLHSAWVINKTTS